MNTQHQLGQINLDKLAKGGTYACGLALRKHRLTLHAIERGESHANKQHIDKLIKQCVDVCVNLDFSKYHEWKH